MVTRTRTRLQRQQHRSNLKKTSRFVHRKNRTEMIYLNYKQCKLSQAGPWTRHSRELQEFKLTVMWTTISGRELLSTAVWLVTTLVTSSSNTKHPALGIYLCLCNSSVNILWTSRQWPAITNRCCNLNNCRKIHWLHRNQSSSSSSNSR